MLKSKLQLRTSATSPLQIATITTSQLGGAIGLTLCPGKIDPMRGWKRDLAADLKIIKKWGATLIITLIEDHEFKILGVERMESAARSLSMDWAHLPITDVAVPDNRFDSAWEALGSRVHCLLDSHERVLVHCRGGLGRAGTLAAQILIERGAAPLAAIDKVRAVRPGAIETTQQANYVLQLGSQFK